MTDDLVKRLRELDRRYSYADKCEAADRIEKLTEALREIVAWPKTVKAKMVKIARKALEGKND
jgi:hypothetical protein